MAVVMAGSVANPVTDSMSKSSISVAHGLPLAPQGGQCVVKRYNSHDDPSTRNIHGNRGTVSKCGLRLSAY